MRSSIRIPQGEELSGLIGTIYEAAREPAPWAEVLSKLAAYLAAPRAALIVPQQFSARFPFTAALGIDPAFWRAYSEHYWQEDILAQAVLGALREGDAGVAQEYVPWRQLERTGFYNDLLKPAGIKAVCAAIISDGTSESLPMPVLMSFYREPGVDDFDPESTKTFLRLVTGHIQRSLQLYTRFETVKAECGYRDSALDAISVGVMLFGGDGCVRYANRLALTVLEQSKIGIRNKRLRSANAAMTEKLSAALKKAASGTASLVKLNRFQWLCGAVTGAKWLDPDSSLIVALISDGTRHTPLAEFASVHGLTPAETRLLEGLLEDDGDPKQLAAKFKIAVSTVRTQLRSIFLKTGTRGQRALIQKILALPPSLLDQQTERH